MIRSGARSGWVLPVLLAVAAILAALSFAPWGEITAAAVTQATPTPPPTTPAQTPAETGRALFGFKGCATCHRHDGRESAPTAAGGQVVAAPGRFDGAHGAPDLTHYQPDPAFVRAWLKDPQALRPGTLMPNLGLTEDEIEALLAFLQE